MVNEVILNNVSEILNTSQIFEQVSPAIMEKFAPLITILKAVGIVFVVYLVYMLVNGILRLRDRSRLKRIEKKVDVILSKLNVRVDKKESESKKKAKKKKGR